MTRFEQLLRDDPWFRERIANAPPAIKALFKTKPVLAPIPVSKELADAAKANPRSVTVRVNARGMDGVVVVDPPRPGAIMEQGEALDAAVKEAEREARVRRENWAQASRDREMLYEKAKAEAQTGVGVVKHIYDPIKEFEGGR